MTIINDNTKAKTNLAHFRTKKSAPPKSYLETVYEMKHFLLMVYKI